MARPRYTIELRDDKRALLRGLVVREAHRLGYGTVYHDGGPDGRSTWPARLRRLSPIARKLMR